MMTIVPELKLSSGNKPIPVIGMGTAGYAPNEAETTKAAIVEAIKVGYRHFDTAYTYGSEKALGEAIAEALSHGLIKSREELFVTTKLWASYAERDLVVPAIKRSLENLRLEYVDLYLIHLPMRLSPDMKKMPPEKDQLMPLDMKSVWEGMEQCVTLGLAKAIGVSNFSIRLLEELLPVAKIPPAVNQVELNAMWPQNKLREFCKTKGIHVEAFSALGGKDTRWGDNRILGNEVLGEIAKAKGRSIAQVALRWVYEQGASIVAKASVKEQMEENLQIFDWSLSEDDLNRISQLPHTKGMTFRPNFGDHELVLQIDADTDQ